MRKWECIVCGWVYDEATGWPEDDIAPGTRWEDIPEYWVCPECGVGKEDFELIEDDAEAAAPPPAASPPAASPPAAKTPAETPTTTPSPPTSPEATQEDPIVIIGSGLAGYNLAKEFRHQDADTPLLIITRDDGTSYHKPMLSACFTRGQSPADLSSGSAAEMAEKLSLQLRCNTTVTALDTAKHTLQCADGSTLRYAKLVLAWGADVVEPPLKGSAMDKVYTVNDLEDYTRFRAALQESGARRILIIGAGLIGSEFTNDLLNGGYALEAVEPLPHSLPTLLPPEAGAAVQEALQEKGARLHFGTVVEEVNHNDTGGVTARLKNGDEIQADLVLSAVGVRPHVALASSAGLETGLGIRVNRYLETSAPDVYALGDCAEVENLVLYYVAPLVAAAHALGKTLAGTRTAVHYPAMPITIKTPACPVVVAPPPKGAPGAWQCTRKGADVHGEFRSPEGRLLGFALTGARTKDKQQLQKELPPLLP